MLESLLLYEDNYKTSIKDVTLAMTGTVGVTKVMESHLLKVSFVIGKLSWLLGQLCSMVSYPAAESDIESREPNVDSWALYPPNPLKLLSRSLSQRLGEERKLLLSKSLRKLLSKFQRAYAQNAAATVNIINESFLSINNASACILLLQLICLPDALVPIYSTKSRAYTGLLFTTFVQLVFVL